MIHYVVVDVSTSCNILHGWTSLNALGTIVFTRHLAMKFPSEQGSMITIHANQKVTRECYMASLKLIPILESQVVNMVTMANMDDVTS